MLSTSPLPKRLAFNFARELIGTYLQPHLYGCTTEHPIPLARGSKQGAPESGMLFIGTMDNAITPTAQNWPDQGHGCRLDNSCLTHLLFVDDLILTSTSLASILRMLHDIVPKLKEIGLDLNEHI